MEIITMNLDELTPAGYNPRKLLAPGDAEYEQIKQSIIGFGMVEPLVWNRQTGNIVGGHQRLTVLRDLGYESIEVSVIDVTEAKEKALNVALNKISGEWDEGKLAELLDEMSADVNEALLSLTGFTEDYLSEMLNVGDVEDTLSQGDDCGQECVGRDSKFNYQEQFGVIVLCNNENDQRVVYEKLITQGFSCKVVAT